jgi:hypothetical protein
MCFIKERGGQKFFLEEVYATCALFPNTQTKTFNNALISFFSPFGITTALRMQRVQKTLSTTTTLGQGKEKKTTTFDVCPLKLVKEIEDTVTNTHTQRDIDLVESRTSQ